MKRSSHIGLALMGVTAIGASSYALSPQRTDCASPASAASQPPAAAQTPQPCQYRRGPGGSSSSGSGWFGHRSSTSTASATTGLSGGSTGIATAARGGFGATGHAASSGG